MATQPKNRRLVTEETLSAQMADEFQGLLEDELPAALEAPAAAATLSVAIGDGIMAAQLPRKALPASAQFAPGFGLAVTHQEPNWTFLCWSHDGTKIYATDQASPSGRTLGVSTDQGQVFTPLTAPDATYSPTYGWDTPAGLFVLCLNRLYKSVDGGATFTLVLTLRTGETILTDGFTRAADGTLYAAIYSSAAGGYAASGAPVYHSTTAGDSWTVLGYLPSTMEGGTGTGAIRHWHGALTVGNDLYLASGDSPTESGIWKWEGGEFVRKTPLGQQDGNSHRWCAVSIIHRDGYLYWALDTNGDSKGLLMKAPLSDLGDYTEVAALPTSSYYSTKMPDGTLLFGGALEVGGSLTGNQDDGYRIWACDAADRVSEAWVAAAHPAGTGNRPVGVVKAHPSSGQVIWTAKNLLDTRTGGHRTTPMSYLGTVRKGVAVTPTPLVPLRAAKVSHIRGTSGTATTTSASTAAAADILEQVEVDLKGTRVLVMWSATISAGTAGARVTLVPTPSAVDVGATADQRSALFPAMNDERNISGQAVITLPKAGRHTICLRWFVSTGSASANLRRNLTVIELPA